MALPPETRTPSRNHKQKVELSFAPLSEGLGFHPFSDGLPYAPMGKTSHSASKATPAQPASQQQPGAGALAAGLPDYRPPPPQRMKAPRIPVAAKPVLSTPTPAAPPLVARAPQPFSHPQFHHRLGPKAPAPTVTALAPELIDHSLGFAYVLKRILAYTIDSAFNLGLCAGALSLALWKQDLSPNLLLSPGIVLVAGLFLGFFNWAITTAEEVAFGTSIGKRLFGLAIQGGASAIFLRSFFFLPSACFGGIGLLWALFDRRRRCWHDLVVDLQPIEIARL